MIFSTAISRYSTRQRTKDKDNMGVERALAREQDTALLSISAVTEAIDHSRSRQIDLSDLGRTC